MKRGRERWLAITQQAREQPNRFAPKPIVRQEPKDETEWLQTLADILEAAFNVSGSPGPEMGVRLLEARRMVMERLLAKTHEKEATANG